MAKKNNFSKPATTPTPDNPRNRERKIPLQVYLSEDELFVLEEKVKESGCASKSAVIRQLILYGFVYDVDYSELQGLHETLSRINANLNQIAKHMNKTGHVYDADVQAVKKLMEEIWQLQRSTALNQPYINQ